MTFEEKMLSETERLVKNGDHKGANIFLRYIKISSKDPILLKKARELWQTGVESALEISLREAEKYSAIAHIDKFERHISKVERYALLVKKDISDKVNDLKVVAYSKAQNDCLNIGMALMYQGIIYAAEPYLKGAIAYSRHTHLDVSEAVNDLIAYGKRKKEIRPELRVEETARIFFSRDYNPYALRSNRTPIKKYEPSKVHFHT